MRILLFVSQLSAGGAEQAAILLSNGLMSLGCEVAMVTARPAGDLISRVNENCQIIDLNSSKPIKATRALSKCVKKFNPSAVVCFGFATGIAARLSKLKFLWRAPLIIRAENNLEIEWSTATPLNRIIGPFLSRWAAHNAHIVAVSRSLTQPTAKFLRIPLSRLTTILNPVIDDSAPSDGARDAALHPWLTENYIPTLVAMGRLEYQKGFDVLIEAFSRTRRLTNARLVIFGKGSLHDTLQKQIESCGMGESIALAGFTPDAIAQMSAAHAFVLSSRFEGFGLVLVEALLAGTKVISTNCDFGPAELLENGRYGKLVPVDDAQALADAMLQSILEPWTAERPDEKWFAQFTATEAARQHLALIGKLRGDPGDLS